MAGFSDKRPATSAFPAGLLHGPCRLEFIHVIQKLGLRGTLRASKTVKFCNTDAPTAAQGKGWTRALGDSEVESVSTSCLPVETGGQPRRGEAANSPHGLSIDD